MADRTKPLSFPTEEVYVDFIADMPRLAALLEYEMGWQKLQVSHPNSVPVPHSPTHYSISSNAWIVCTYGSMY